MNIEDNRPIPEIGQEKNNRLQDGILHYAIIPFLLVMFWQSWIRYEAGSKSITENAEWGSISIATALIFCNYIFPSKGLKKASLGVFVISLFFSVNASTKSIVAEFAKYKKIPLTEQKSKEPLPNCPDASKSWVNYQDCKDKFPQAEKERLEHNLRVGEFNSQLPQKNSEIDKYNSELSFAKLPIQSQISILLYLLLSVAIPSVEMYTVFVFHNGTKTEKGKEVVTRTTFKIIFPWTKLSTEDALREICMKRNWNTTVATDKLQSLGFSNVEIAEILKKHKSTISRRQTETPRKQPVLFALPRKDNKQPELIPTGTEVNHVQLFS